MCRKKSKKIKNHKNREKLQKTKERWKKIEGSAKERQIKIAKIGRSCNH